MTARMLGTGWMRLWALPPLAVLALLAGCSHDRGYDRGASGGSCCGGSAPTPGAVAADNAPSGGSCCGGSRPTPAADHLSGANVTPATESYGGQKTCPVTGEKLGSMGPALPVTVQGQTIYVCCPGCVAKVQRDPDAYLRKVNAERTGQSP